MCAWSMFKPFQEAHQENRTTNYTLVDDSDFKTKRGFLVSTIWRILYADDPEAVHVKGALGSEDFSLEFSHIAGIFIWISYQIIMTVLMINILIAIMNTTYSEVWKSAESEWKFERTRYLVGFIEIIVSEIISVVAGRILPSSCLLSFPFLSFLLHCQGCVFVEAEKLDKER